MARKMTTTQSRRWDKFEIERLKYYLTIYGDNMKKIADKFPNRTYKAVSAAIKNLKKGKLGHSEKRSKKKTVQPESAHASDLRPGA